MEEEARDIEGLVDRLADKEKKRRRNALFYLALPVLAGVFLIFWTGWQAETITTQVRTISTQADTISTQAERMGALGYINTTLQVQLAQTRMAMGYVWLGLSNFYGGDYNCAIRQYDKAIELDSLNPVVYELKSESLLKKGEIEKASDILNKGVKIDSVQQKERTDILHYVPKEGDKLKAMQRMETLKQLKADSQDVIRRKLKAQELKGR